MAKKDKIRRPRAETPKGFRDYFGAEVTERKAMLDKIAEVYHLYGFEALECAAVETVESRASSCLTSTARTRVSLRGRRPGKKTATGWPCAMT